MRRSRSQDDLASRSADEERMEERVARPRIADVAQMARVSKTAVSFAFNNPDRLSPDTAQRIRSVAEAIGYRPHPVARMLTQRRTGSIGVVTPQALSMIFANPFFGAFSEGVARAAEDAGYGLHFISPDRGSLARAMDRATVDGIVVVGLPSGHPEVGKLRDAGLPMVLVDSAAMPEQPTITVDDEGGAYAAARHVLDLGHTAVVVLGIAPLAPYPPSDVHDVGTDRLRGYDRAFRERGLALADGRLLAAASTIEGGAAAFRSAWDGGLRPTAVVAMSDAIAIGVLTAARSLGLRVPDDLSIVGFDDIDFAMHTDPPLTTVHQPIRRKGEAAMRLLLALVERRGRDHDQPRRLETHLVVRGSTGPVPPGRQEVTTAQG